MYLNALFVASPFKLFSQVLNVWYDYGDVFVLLTAVVIPVVVDLVLCLDVAVVEIVF